jgi:hypothetical protein
VIFGGQTNFNFHGMLDDVRIYNRALTASEVSALSGHRVPLVKVTTWRADHRVVGAKRSNKSPMAGELVGA